MHIENSEKTRAQLRDDGKQVTGLDLVKYLKSYAAQLENKYVKILESNHFK